MHSLTTFYYLVYRTFDHQVYDTLRFYYISLSENFHNIHAARQYCELLLLHVVCSWNYLFPQSMQQFQTVLKNLLELKRSATKFINQQSLKTLQQNRFQHVNQYQVKDVAHHKLTTMQIPFLSEPRKYHRYTAQQILYIRNVRKEAWCYVNPLPNNLDLNLLC